MTSIQTNTLQSMRLDPPSWSMTLCQVSSHHPGTHGPWNEPTPKAKNKAMWESVWVGIEEAETGYEI